MRLVVALAIGAGVAAAGLFVVRATASPGGVLAVREARIGGDLLLRSGSSDRGPVRHGSLHLGSGLPHALQLAVADERSVRRGDHAQHWLTALPGLELRAGFRSSLLGPMTDVMSSAIVVGGVGIGPAGLSVAPGKLAIGERPEGMFGQLLGLPMELGKDPLAPHAPGPRVRIEATSLSLASAHPPERGVRLTLDASGLTLVDGAGVALRWSAQGQP